MRCGFRTSCMFMPHSSGQRQGLLRNSPEIAHKVSPRLTVYSSGALVASSESGTPAWATCSAVVRWPGVIGYFWASAGPATKLAAKAATAAQALRAEGPSKPNAVSCVIFGLELSWCIVGRDCRRGRAQSKVLIKYWQFCAQALDWATLMALASCRKSQK